MKNHFELTRDELSARIINMLEEVRINTHPDFTRFWELHGPANEWNNAIVELENTASTGNVRAIEFALRKCKRRLKETVVHHNEFLKILQRTIDQPGYSQVPLRFAPEEMREQLIEAYGISGDARETHW